MIDRYTRPEFAEIWSDHARFEALRRVEVAACEEMDGPTPSELEAIAGATFTVAAVDERERVTDHDVAAFVDVLSESAGPAGRWIHYGLTSSDVLDTGLALQIRAAGELLLADARELVQALAQQARAHAHTLCIGRTHGIHAEPTTFGIKLAGFAFEAARNLDRLERAFAQAAFGALSGAVGTYAATSPEFEARVLARLELAAEPVSTQVIPRDRHAELLEAIALAGAGLERLATEIRHLARTEVAEAREPFRTGQKGSSSMPHKRNPIKSEQIAGLARVLRGNANAAVENVALWHERDISHSSVERIILPDSTTLLDHMQRRMLGLVRGLVIDPERMVENLELTYGAIFSQRLLLALVQTGLARDDAYQIAQRLAQRAFDTRVQLRALLEAGEGGPPCEGLDLDAIFSYAPYVRYADEIVGRLDAIAAPLDDRIPRVSVVADLPLIASGKVREIYDLEDRLLLVASDRVSTYDAVHPTPIPGKGAVLTGLTDYWLSETRSIVPNHFVSVTDGVPEDVRGRAMVVRKLRMLPVEAVVRGYLSGSGWRDYRATGSVSGIELPAGLLESARLPEPLFTPSTKADVGAGHDEAISFEQAAELIGSEALAVQLRDAALSVYRFAAERALSRGVILADTKFEFGLDEHGVLTLGDEVCTPDSSRFWPADAYRPGQSQPSFDKQFVRDWATSTGWNQLAPAPEIPAEVVERTHEKYVDAYERITGQSFSDWLHRTHAPTPSHPGAPQI